LPTTTTLAGPGQESPTSTTAISGLATLPIKGRAPLTGYSRGQFGPAWTDDVTVTGGHNGCDTRNDILHRDLTDVVVELGSNGCTVATGVLHDPYTNTIIDFTRGSGTSTVVQIDHVVALADAWQTGAQQLSLSVRTNMANDPLELLAVSGSANQQKGDADAASWLPPNKSFRCSYVAIQVAVKVTYHLWVTPAEHDAIARVLSTCPTQPLPTEGPPASAPGSTTIPPPSVSPLPTGSVPTSTPATNTGVSIVSVTSPVRAGAYASLSAQTSANSSCNLSVTLPSGRESESSGLGSATADSSGRVTWHWLTGTNTDPGTATTTVTCDAATATTTIQIT
jgi:hypothetical protein